MQKKIPWVLSAPSGAKALFASNKEWLEDMMRHPATPYCLILLVEII
jgi:hypothetical protein